MRTATCIVARNRPCKIAPTAQNRPGDCRWRFYVAFLMQPASEYFSRIRAVTRRSVNPFADVADAFVSPCQTPTAHQPFRLLTPGRYLTSTDAPASTNLAFAASASSFATPSLTAFGAPSTRSFASFRPRLVNSRTALMTWILFAPAPVRITSNSVCSTAASAGAASPPAAPRHPSA